MSFKKNLIKMNILLKLNDDCLAEVCSRLSLKDINNIMTASNGLNSRITRDWKFIVKLLKENYLSNLYLQTQYWYIKKSYGILNLDNNPFKESIKDDILKVKKKMIYPEFLDCINCTFHLLNREKVCNEHYICKTLNNIDKFYLYHEIYSYIKYNDIFVKFKRENPYIEDEYFHDSLVKTFDKLSDENLDVSNLTTSDEYVLKDIYDIINQKYNSFPKTENIIIYELFLKSSRSIFSQVSHKRYSKSRFIKYNSIMFVEFKNLVDKRRLRDLELYKYPIEDLLEFYSNKHPSSGVYRKSTFKEIYDSDKKWCEFIYNSMRYEDKWQDFIDFYSIILRYNNILIGKPDFIIV